VKIFLTIAGVIDRCNDRLGRLVAFLTLAMVLVTVTIVVLRYGFSIGYIWMQESVRFMHGFVFLLCAAYTLLQNGHVRVDIFYVKMSPKKKAMVDIFGTVFFLIPVCSVILIFSWDYILNSWRDMEGSMEERGLHAVFILKTCIWVFAVSMILQGLSLIIRSLTIIVGDSESKSTSEQAGAV
jgi:TRAP-type mannitol/chloroaromatic compound transport system permease small subunit